LAIFINFIFLSAGLVVVVFLYLHKKTLNARAFAV